MTTKQEQFIVSLLNRITGRSERFISQHRRFLSSELGLNSGKSNGKLSKAEASALIDRLQGMVK